MRILEFIKQKLKSFFTSQSALSIPYFSISQQLFLFVLALFLFSLFYFKFHPPSPSLPEAVCKEFVVEVAGEVWKPGVYLFQHSPSLKEVIEKVGGLKGSASIDPDLSNEVLKTGTLITIQKISPSLLAGVARSEGEQIKIKIGRMDANKLLVFNIPLDLNQVTIEELYLIPGIGESLAQEIIAYRQRRKRFHSVDELKQVKGIGEKKWKEFKKYFAVH